MKHNFDIKVLLNWKKTIMIPKKVAQYLNKDYVFMINDIEISYHDIVQQKI